MSKKHSLPEIEYTMMRDKHNDIVKFEAIKLVKKLGDSAHVSMPIAMLGKIVKIIYKKEEQKSEKTNN